MLNGRILCKGNGLKVYFETTLYKKATGEPKVFRYEVGTIDAVLDASSRDVGLSYVAGKSKAVGVNRGSRNCYGKVVFSMLDQGIVNGMIGDVKAYNTDKTDLINVNMDDYVFGSYTINQETAALIGSATEKLEVAVSDSEVYLLDDLPLLDIVITGNADNIDEGAGVFEPNTTYKKVLKKCTFLSESFGISAGAPLHNISTNILILGGIEPWQKA